MTIICEQISANEITVNGKFITEDNNGNWIARNDNFNVEEAKFFNLFLKTMRTLKTNKLLKATYTL